MYIFFGDVTAVATSTFVAPALRRAVALLDPESAVSMLKGGDSQLEKWSSLIGIVTAIIGNILISFALNIQRYAHIRLHNELEEKRSHSKLAHEAVGRGYGTTDQSRRSIAGDNETDGRESPDSAETVCPDDDHHEDQEGSYLKSPYWWAGITLMTVGEAGNFLAYGFAPASIVSPLGVVALISNCLIAPIMLKERFRWRDFWGVVIAVGGAVTVVLSARQEEKRLGPHEVIGAITTTAFEIYMGVTAALIIVLAWASPRYGKNTILIDLGLVGLFGGYTALSTKGVASMLSATLWKAFATPITYALIVVLIITAIMQVKYVNKALQRFDSTQVIPVQFVMFTISVIVGSAVLYRDFEHATTEMFVKFIGGCLLTFFGVWLITSGRSKEDDEDDSDEDHVDEAGEERIGLHKQDMLGSDLRRRHYTDGTDENDLEPPTRSRRSSKVSFAIQHGRRPETPRMQSSSSMVPSVRVSSSSSNGEGATLLSNPWKTSKDESLSTTRAHPGIPSTISSPLLPTEASMASDPNFAGNAAQQSPLGHPLSRTASQADPYTHPNLQQPGPPAADPGASLGLQRPVTPRHSLSSRMLPGPYLSPLSSSLSAVVADTLRRKSSYRRPKLGLRRSKSGSRGVGGLEEYEDDPLLGVSPSRATPSAFGIWLGRSVTNEEVQAEGSSRSDINVGLEGRKARARSLSNTLGDLIRGKRQRKDSRSSDAEEGRFDDNDESGLL